jgi:hypothetical protein
MDLVDSLFDLILEIGVGVPSAADRWTKDLADQECLPKRLGVFVVVPIIF